MSVQEWVVKEPYLHLPCSLGEGPHYHAPSQTLRFLDINKRNLHLVHLPSGPSSLRTISTTQPVGVTADIAGKDPEEVILCGAKDGVTKFWVKEGRHEYVVRYWGEEGVLGGGLGEGKREEGRRRFRSNDGGVDTKGRFWVEAFVDPEVDGKGGGEGVLMRLEPGEGSLVRVLDGVTIPNGISWSEDDGEMFFTDSPAQVVYRMRYERESGAVGEKEVFYKHEGEGEFPDGHVMDVEGNIWHAVYGGAKVVRISREGKVTGVVRLPTKNITCPVFVGTELFMTSAKQEGEEFAGSVFKVDVGVEGVKKREVRM